MLDLQQTFRSMVIADIKGEASPEEVALLRSDENLNAWRTELEGYLTELDAEIKRRKAAVFSLVGQGGDRAEVNEARADSMHFEVAALQLKAEAKRRLGEAKALRNKRSRRLQEEHNRMQQESAQLHRNAERVKALEADRLRYRNALYDVRRFIEPDEAFKPEFLPLRDVLLTKVDDALYRPTEEEDKQ